MSSSPDPRPLDDTASPDTGSALPVGTQLSDFTVTGVIGEGGFGIVYLASDLFLQRAVAIKEYMPSALARRLADHRVVVRSQRHEDTFAAGMRSFINEARLLARFDHPALVKVYRFWEANGTAYMAMPYYRGVTLKQALRDRREPVDQRWLSGVLAPLMDAIEALHEEQCFHRDIAPDNILMTDPDTPVLLDFGAARQVIGDMTQALTVILKPGYAPIEQYAEIPGMRQGAWTDVYALAAVLYYAVSGKAPLPAVARMVDDHLVPLARLAPPGFSPEFLLAIDHALAFKPEARTADIAQFRRELGLAGTTPGYRGASRGIQTRLDAAPAATTVSMPTPAVDAASLPTVLVAAPVDPDATLLVPPAGRVPSPAEPVFPPSAPGLHAPAAAASVAASVAAPTRPVATAAPQPAVRGRGRVVAVAALLVVLAVPVAWLMRPTPVPTSTSTPTVAATPPVAAPTASSPTASSPMAAAPPAATPAAEAAPSATPAVAPVPPPADPPAVAVAIRRNADLIDALAGGANAAISVSLKTEPAQARIGKDRLRLVVNSNTSGYLYLFMLGSDEEQLIQLLPNARDVDNRVTAGQALNLPRASWQMVSQGPPGRSRFVAVVSREPRFYNRSGLVAGEPFAAFDLAQAGRNAAANGPAAVRGWVKCAADADASCDSYGVAQADISELR